MTTGARNVEDTAFVVAGLRAAESERRNPAFHDALARKLAGQPGSEGLRPGSAGLAWYVVIRTVIIDGLIQRLAAGDVDTVVNLGAGLDTRPYRLDLPASLRWVEVDLPGVIDFKTERLADETPKCRLERYACDLADRAQRRKLLTSLSQNAGRSLVLTEFVIPYLTEDSVADLAVDLRRMEGIAYWIVEYFAPVARPNRKPAADGSGWLKFRPVDWFGFFQQRGWRAGEVHSFSEAANRLGRQFPLPARTRLALRLKRLFAVPRGRRPKREAAYVVLIPD